MKQRVTYLLPAGSGIEQSDIQVTSESLNFTKADQASEEWKLTLGVQELPEELQEILQYYQELHIRWSSPHDQRLDSPLVSRLPAGFHLCFKPRHSTEDVRFCKLLQNLLGDDPAECRPVTEMCSPPPTLFEFQSTPRAYQYYRYAAIDNTRIASTFLQKVCKMDSPKQHWPDVCKSRIPQLENAASFDFDFDMNADVATLTTLWSSGKAGSGDAMAKAHKRFGTEDRLEVGVLQSEAANEPEELSLGGFLTIVGEDDRPSPTLFSFPSRHHPLPLSSPATFTADFQHPTGLHPKLQITLPRRHLTPPKDTCTLHAYLTLPSTVFLDQYQLLDHLFLQSQNLIGVNALAGEQDLEAPDWVVKRWGSAALFQLRVPEDAMQVTHASEDWIATIPMHLRYVDASQRTADASDGASVSVPWPIVFWACDPVEDTKMSTNPFDRVNLGYDGIFPPATTFYHVSPAPHVRKTVNEISIPVLSTQNASGIQVGTLLAVAIGFGWICWQLLRSRSSPRRARDQHKKAQ